MLDSIGKLLLRLSIGGMILLHGIYKMAMFALKVGISILSVQQCPVNAQV
jgi:hypothetical protein